MAISVYRVPAYCTCAAHETWQRCSREHPPKAAAAIDASVSPNDMLINIHYTRESYVHGVVRGKPGARLTLDGLDLDLSLIHI